MRLDAREIVARAMEKGLDWQALDSEMNDEVRREYAFSARLILDSHVWQNETKRIIDTLVRHIACQSTSYDNVLDLRMTINAVVLLQDRLQEIAAWNKLEEKANDPFEGI